MMLAEILLCAVFIIVKDANGVHERMLTEPTEDITACVKEGSRIGKDMKQAYPDDKTFEITFRIAVKKDKQA